MSTLVILAHPNMKESIVNHLWKRELEQENIYVHDLYETYPDEKLDVIHEQELIEQHDTIVFQFPFYWYSSPPLLKKWLDEVLEEGWAHGSRFSLEGKKIALAISIGDKQYNYEKTGKVTFSLDELISPYIATAIYIKAHYAGYHAMFNVASATEDQITADAKELAAFIKSL
ncbi:NAD(P)H-dependent oxidoreductase [Macrococcus brunensis]|uniref:NAD(P)H-dependent oxidoreductase n=1 Tax=Macrococcus brunensis TaxID=198483 RepID=UPI001EF15CE7|nr:NAD(P)H-dependent oxidoreductase [Macrococcus brunensis]ULG74514.1 NAD(P)H-dependent oxidoreductase [Macrococcus brunensis]